MAPAKQVKTLVSADEWFSEGRRVLFDPLAKEIVHDEKCKSTTVAVFERVVGSSTSPDTRWVTMLPGFPDGSYGFSKVDRLLTVTPRLYIDYVGQGDSDKPSKYKYGTMERADLVEAEWKAHGIQRTVLVTFDYSSLVMLELLQRQRERLESSLPPLTKIEHVLSINGGFFADGHSHPITTTPVLKTPLVGNVGAWAAQHSDWVFDTMLTPLYDKQYKVTKAELRQVEHAIRRHKGAAFLANAAGFVDEHKRHAARWNLEDVYEHSRTQHITFHLVGSEKDQFEPKQIVLARKRIGASPDVTITTIPGGHMSTSEQAAQLAEFVHSLANMPSSD